MKRCCLWIDHPSDLYIAQDPSNPARRPPFPPRQNNTTPPHPTSHHPTPTRTSRGTWYGVLGSNSTLKSSVRYATRLASSIHLWGRPDRVGVGVGVSGVGEVRCDAGVRGWGYT